MRRQARARTSSCAPLVTENTQETPSGTIGHAVLPVPNGLKKALIQPHRAVETRRA